MARPSKLTVDVIRRVCDAIRDGNCREVSARLAGIHPATLFDWLRKAKAQGKGRFHEFSEALKKAEAEAEGDRVLLIKQASVRSWQAAAWWLERRRPERYALLDPAELKRLGKEIEEINSRVHGQPAPEAPQDPPPAGPARQPA